MGNSAAIAKFFFDSSLSLHRKKLVFDFEKWRSILRISRPKADADSLDGKLEGNCYFTS
jgi:hypothetical protein